MSVGLNTHLYLFWYIPNCASHFGQLDRHVAPLSSINRLDSVFFANLLGGSVHTSQEAAPFLVLEHELPGHEEVLPHLPTVFQSVATVVTMFSLPNFVIP